VIDLSFREQITREYPQPGVSFCKSGKHYLGTWISHLVTDLADVVGPLLES
jgi:hypothetical protein